MPKPWLTALGTILLSGCTYRVDSLVDAVDANPGDFVCEREIPEGGLTTGDDGGLCTLRAAIMEANASALGRDRIEIPSGQYQLVLPVNVGGGRLEISEDVVIQGSGAASTIIDGNDADIVFEIVSGEVSINHVTVRGGDSGAGGGIRIADGEVEINDAVVRDNAVTTGGGGILVEANGSATVRRSTITDNQANGAFGGGIWNQGELFVFESAITDNQSNRAGGIQNSGILNLRNTTVSGNQAVSTEAGTGGLSQTGFAFLNNVTITDNTGVGDDPGSFSGGGLDTSSGTTVVKNSIIAGNDGGVGPDDCVGALTADSKHNLIGNTDGCTITSFVATYVLDVDAQLGPLGNHGGPTRDHVPQAGSPALGAAFPFPPGGPAADSCEGPDQRGVPRPQGGDACDMGAVEVTGTSTSIGGFVLVDAAADVDIRPLLNGDILDLSTLPPELSIRAAISLLPGSVVFGFDGDPAFRTENANPYALGGDIGGDYAPVALAPGDYTIAATPFAAADGGGAAGAARSIGFTVQP